MRNILLRFGIVCVGIMLVSCTPSAPLVTPDAASASGEPVNAGQPAPPAAKPEIAEVRLALAIDPKTRVMKGSGATFKASILNRVKKLHIAIGLLNLQGGETLSITLMNPQRKESEPIVQQYGEADRGDFFATASFESARWRPGPHRITINLNDQSFAVHDFLILP